MTARGSWSLAKEGKAGNQGRLHGGGLGMGKGAQGASEKTQLLSVAYMTAMWLLFRLSASLCGCLWLSTLAPELPLRLKVSTKLP